MEKLMQHVVKSVDRLAAINCLLASKERRGRRDTLGRALIRREIGILIRRAIKLWWMTWKKPGMEAK